MLYRVLVDAEISSDLPIAKVEELLQLALVSPEANEIAIDHKFSDRFAVNDYHNFEVQRIPDECIYCGEPLQDRMVDMFGLLEEKEICIDPSCEGSRYYG